MTEFICLILATRVVREKWLLLVLIAKPNGEDRLLRKVVKGMLPKNRLGAKLLSNMYVYAGSEHKHDAQNPKAIDNKLT